MDNNKMLKKLYQTTRMATLMWMAAYFVLTVIGMATTSHPIRLDSTLMYIVCGVTPFVVLTSITNWVQWVRS